MIKIFNKLVLLATLINLLTSCDGQTNIDKQNLTTAQSNIKKVVGGGCEGCELMYVGMPENISHRGNVGGRSWCLFNFIPSKNIGVAIMSNAGDPQTGEVIIQLKDYLLSKYVNEK